MKKIIFGVLIFLMVGRISLMADQISLFEENDLTAGTDHFYTNGSRLQYLFDNDFGISIGQNMYTPTDLESTKLIPNDRPYCGYLYGSIFYTWYYDHSEIFIENQIGMVGPDSFAEQTQQIIHKWIGSVAPQGWKNQIPNHFTETVLSKYTYKIIDSQWIAVDPFIAMDTGNFIDRVGAGCNVYLGYNLPEKRNTQRVIPLKMEKNESFFNSFYTYVYGGVEPMNVLHNMTLDDDRFTITPERYVNNKTLGYVIGCNRTELAFTFCETSKEFEQQPGPEKFGSVKLSVNF